MSNIKDENNEAIKDWVIEGGKSVRDIVVECIKNYYSEKFNNDMIAIKM